MASLLKRITRMRGELEEQAAGLRKQLADAEAELARFEAAEQVVARLLADEHPAADHPPVADVTEPEAPRPTDMATVPQRDPGSQVTIFPPPTRS